MSLDATHASPLASLSMSAAPVPVPEQAGPQDTAAALERAEAEIDRALGDSEYARLECHVDAATRATVLQVVERRSGAVLFQAPCAIAAALAQALGLVPAADEQR